MRRLFNPTTIASLLLLSSMMSLRADEEPGRLTPPIAPQPQINGAKVYGARPNADILFRIPTSGQAPLQFSASGLPAGVKLEPSKGILYGKVSKPGTYPIQIAVKNAKGTAKSSLKLVIGNQILLTPPMGWNSWYRYSEAISDEAVRTTAKAMHEKGLADFGWSYVNIDDCWQGAKRDAQGAIMANERFPDMKKMTTYVHSLGIKAGIYSTPYIGSYAGFMGSTMPDDGNYDKISLPLDKRKQSGQLFGTYPGAQTMGAQRIGAWKFDVDMKRLAEWGFDLIKVDWNPIDIPTTERIAKDIGATGRDIALSLSNHASLASANDYARLSQLWRTSGDITDNWNSVSNNGFNLNPQWAHVSKPGNWNDPDMLQIGEIGTPNRFGEFHQTHLTPNEQYSQVSLWVIQAAPLILSCDLEKLDDFTLGLITNREVIAVHQDELGKAGKLQDLGNNIVAFQKPLVNGSIALAVFNRGEQAADFSSTLESLQITKGKYLLRDLWRCAPAGETDSSLKARIGRHGVQFWLLTPKP